MKNKQQKLSEEDKEHILKEYNEGVRTTKLGAKYGVSSARIYLILNEFDALGREVKYTLKNR